MRCNLLERLQPFSSDRWFEIREPRKVASGSAEVGDDTCTLRIGDSDKYRWNRLRGLPNRGQNRRACGKNDLGSRGDERGSVSSEAFCIAGSKVIIYMNVAAFDPTKCRPQDSNALMRCCESKLAMSTPIRRMRPDCCARAAAGQAAAAAPTTPRKSRLLMRAQVQENASYRLK